MQLTILIIVAVIAASTHCIQQSQPSQSRVNLRRRATVIVDAASRKGDDLKAKPKMNPKTKPNKQPPLITKTNKPKPNPDEKTNKTTPTHNKPRPKTKPTNKNNNVTHQKEKKKTNNTKAETTTNKADKTKTKPTTTKQTTSKTKPTPSPTMTPTFISTASPTANPTMTPTSDLTPVPTDAPTTIPTITSTSATTTPNTEEAPREGDLEDQPGGFKCLVQVVVEAIINKIVAIEIVEGAVATTTAGVAIEKNTADSTPRAASEHAVRCLVHVLQSQISEDVFTQSLKLLLTSLHSLNAEPIMLHQSSFPPPIGPQCILSAEHKKLLAIISQRSFEDEGSCFSVLQLDSDQSVLRVLSMLEQFVADINLP